jgi:hypothetical protein
MDILLGVTEDSLEVSDETGANDLRDVVSNIR